MPVPSDQDYFYREFFDNGPEAFFVLDGEGRVEACNDAILEFLGLETKDDVLHRPWWRLVSSRTWRDVFTQDVAVVKSDGLRRTFVAGVNQRDGSLTQIAGAATIVLNEDQSAIARVHCVARPVDTPTHL